MSQSMFEEDGADTIPEVTSRENNSDSSFMSMAIFELLGALSWKDMRDESKSGWRGRKLATARSASVDNISLEDPLHQFSQ